MENVLGAESEEQLADDLSQLSTWQRGSEGPSRSHDDPYAQASIVIHALPADEGEIRRLVMKRKVLRHRSDGTVESSMSQQTSSQITMLSHRAWCIPGLFWMTPSPKGS